MKSVLISIQPKWCEIIANGKKTIEVRKTKPKLKTPFKCYIYCTKPKNYYKISSCMAATDENLYLSDGKIKMSNGFEFWANGVEYERLNGKVIGEFVCDKIYEIGYDYFHPVGYEVSMGEISREELYKKSCLSFNQIDYYLNAELGYGWHISNLVIYDKPRELGEFSRKCEKTPCEGCEHLKYQGVNSAEYDYDCEFLGNRIPITRPPQSWCYVEELV